MTLKHHGAYGAICFDDGQAEWPKRRWSWSPDVWDWPEKRSLPDDIFCIVTVGTGWNPAYDPASGPPARASVCANSWHASFWSGVSAVGPLCVAKGDDTNNGAAVSVPPGEELPGAVWGMVTTFRSDRLRPGWSNYGIDPAIEVISGSVSGINRIRHDTFSLSIESDRRDPYFTDCDFDFVSGYAQSVTGTTEISATLHEGMPWAAFGLALYGV